MSPTPQPSSPAASPPSLLEVLLAGGGADLEIAAGAHGAATKLPVADLLGLAARVAHHFRLLGLGPGETVLLGLSTGPALVASILAAWCAGARASCVAPIGPLGRRALSTPWIKQILDVVHPRIVVAEPAVLAAVRDAGSPGAVLVHSEDLPLRGRAEPSVGAPRLEDVALLQLTSGSTGSPQAIEITHANLVTNLTAINQRLRLTAQDRFVSWLPLHHDMGLVGGLCVPLYHRIPARLIPTETFVRAPLSWLEAISETSATMSPAPPFAYSMLAHRIRSSRLGEVDLSSWRVAFIGAETIYERSLERFAERFAEAGFRPVALTPCYGLAEATLAVTMVEADRPYRVLHGDLNVLRQQRRFEPRPAKEAGAPFVGLGRAMDGLEVVVADEAGQPLPEHHVGRIVVSGGSITRRVHSAGGAIEHGGKLDTGDLGFLSDGELFFVSRSKDVIIRAGANIAPSELERVAEEIEGVRRGCVAAFGCVRPDLGRDEIVVVAETRHESDAQRARLAEEVRSRITGQAGIQVDEVLVVGPGSLPKTTSGKIQRALCRQLYLDDGLRRRGRPGPLVRARRALGALWRRLRS